MNVRVGAEHKPRMPGALRLAAIRIRRLVQNARLLSMRANGLCPLSLPSLYTHARCPPSVTERGLSRHKPCTALTACKSVLGETKDRYV